MLKGENMIFCGTKLHQKLNLAHKFAQDNKFKLEISFWPEANGWYVKFVDGLNKTHCGCCCKLLEDALTYCLEHKK